MFNNIMIVDESESERRLIRRNFQAEGFKNAAFIETSHVIDALKLIKTFQIDLIITELDLPEMDGASFIKQIKNSPVMDDIPVIVISNPVNDNQKKVLLENGITSIVEKPVSSENIRRVLNPFISDNKNCLDNHMFSHMDEGESDPEIKDIPEILIINDSKIDCLLLTNILIEENYKIDYVETVNETFQFLKKTHPDLILLDTKFEGMKGYEICKKIKSKRSTKEIPVLFTTANNLPEERVVGFKAGCEDFITSPFSPEEVLARINTHLRLGSALRTIRCQKKNLEERLKEKTEFLAKSERQAVFGQFVQGIVHNIRNPLSSIQGNAQLANMYINSLLEKESNNCDPENENSKIYIKINDNLDKIQRNGNRLKEMVNSIMSKSRNDQNGEFEELDLNEFIKDELSFLKADLWFTDTVKKTVNLSEHPVKVKVVPGMISQVFNNITRNALDSMYNLNKPEISFTTGANGKTVFFSITDNGPGIPEKVMKKIFDPFFTTKPKQKKAENNAPAGTGLGLFVSRDMVEYHNGFLEVFNNQSKGATFKVSLPTIDEIRSFE